MNFKKIVSIAVAALMMLTMATTAFAVPSTEEPAGAPETTAATASAVKSNGTVAVTLSDGSSSSSDFVAANHSYNAIKLFDLYKVVEADGTTQVEDANGNHVYQYRMVPEMTAAMATELEADIEAIGNGWAFDPQTCAITLNGADIATQFGVNEKTSDAAKLAACLAAFADKYKNTLPKTTMSIDTAANLVDGYYVIYEASNSANDGSVATKPILLNVNRTEEGGQKDITLKDAKVEVDKQIVTTNAHSANGDDYAIGDVINFEIDANFPVFQVNTPESFEPTFEFADTLSAGLTLDTTSIVVTVNDTVVAAGADTFATTGTGANALAIAFDPDFILAHQGESVVVTYSAALNENAAYNDEDGNVNHVVLTYSNNPMNISDTKTLEDETTSYTYAFDLRKLDGVDDSHLAGAVFELKEGNTVITFSMGANGEYIVDPEGTVTEITTVATGDITIIGLDEGTYTLHEKSAPSGYSLLAQDVQVVIAAETFHGEITGACSVTVTNGTAITDTANDSEGASKLTGVAGDSDVNVVVRNYRGINLPETGSISAIVIGITGLVTVLGGAFVARKKND